MEFPYLFLSRQVPLAAKDNSCSITFRPCNVIILAQVLILIRKAISLKWNHLTKAEVVTSILWLISTYITVAP